MQCLEPYETLWSTINKYMSLNNNFINKYYLNNKLNRLMHDNEAQLSYFTCLWVTVCLQVGQILQAQ